MIMRKLSVRVKYLLMGCFITPKSLQLPCCMHYWVILNRYTSITCIFYILWVILRCGALGGTVKCYTWVPRLQAFQCVSIYMLFKCKFVKNFDDVIFSEINMYQLPPLETFMTDVMKRIKHFQNRFKWYILFQQWLFMISTFLAFTLYND